MNEELKKLSPDEIDELTLNELRLLFDINSREFPKLINLTLKEYQDNKDVQIKDLNIFISIKLDGLLNSLKLKYLLNENKNLLRKNKDLAIDLDILDGEIDKVRKNIAETKQKVEVLTIQVNTNTNKGNETEDRKLIELQGRIYKAEQNIERIDRGLVSPSGFKIGFDDGYEGQPGW